ncbi:MAG: four helix bundle protein [bacterium]|nr:four helix bundle protein [bacterium]
MSELNFHKNLPIQTPPPQRLLPLLQRLKEIYLLWYGYYTTLPKVHRHSLGQRIDNLFIEIIEFIAIASFLSKEEKLPYVKVAIRKTDTLKVLLMVLWETKSLDNKKYIALSVKIEEIGKMLGGWSGQITKSFEQARDKQNSPKKGEK